MDKCLQEIFDIIVADTGMLLFLELVAVYHINVLDFIFEMYKRFQKYISRFRTDFDIGSITFKRAS